MVAISLYRGNLHRVPDVPRRWLMPTRQISLKDFRVLLSKREKAFSALFPTTSSNPNPNPNPNPNSEKQEEEVVGDNGCSKQILLQIGEISQPQLQSTVVPSKATATADSSEDGPSQPCKPVEVDKVHIRSDADEEGKEIGDPDSSPGAKSSVPEADCGVKDVGVCGMSEALEEKNPVVSAPQPVEINNNVDVVNDRENNKEDLKQKLQVLKERKHHLVQMLKLILNAEEEIKRRNSMQTALVVRVPAPLQLEADTGPNPRLAGTKLGPEANSCGDLEGESEDVPNHNTQARNFHQMRITSPSAPSPLRKPALSLLQHNSVPNSTRPSVGVGGITQPTSSILGIAASPSPSRFAPTGHQGHPPSLSLSGTHFTASSPSPAASGGTSVFRDTRLTSPSWN